MNIEKLKQIKEKIKWKCPKCGRDFDMKKDCECGYGENPQITHFSD